MPISTISSKGQVTIPIDVRRRLGLHRGDLVEFRVEGDGSVTLRPVGRRASDVYGFLSRPRGRTLTVSEMDESLADAVAEEDAGPWDP